VEDFTNKIIANLVFGISDAVKQLQTLERMAAESARRIQEQFQKTTFGDTTGPLTAQQARAQAILEQTQAKSQAILQQAQAKEQAILQESEAKKASIIAKNEAEISQIKAKESAIRQEMALREARNQEAIASLQALTAQKIQESETRKTSIIAKNEAEISKIKAQENAIRQVALTREQAILQQSEARKTALIAKNEAEISRIRAHESAIRQKIALQEAQKELATVKQQVEQERLLYMQARRAAFEEKPKGFAGLMERRLSWLASGALLIGGSAALNETISTINEVEKQMTTIARVTEDATFNFKGMRDELQKLAIEYGTSWVQVSDIAIRWAQAGYGMNETLELTKASLLALNTAELNAEQATQSLIGIMAQWGLTADQLLPTIDKINKVADDFAITSQDLVDGLLRSSGAAKVMGLSLEQTIAILTTMREASGRTGKEVGNALNSILSFIQRPKSIEAFEKEGIAIFTDKTRTQFRNVIEIFDDLAKRWPKMSDATRDMFVAAAEEAGLYSEELAEVVGMQKQLTDIQQRDLSQAAAGIYRRNYLISLLQNWSKIDEVLIAQENALGYSMRENERTMQTLDKQYQQLKAAAEQLAVALGDTGLLNELKALVEGATSAIEWFNSLNDTLKTFIITVVEVTAAVKILGMFLGASGIGGLAKGVGEITETAKGIGSIATATTLLSSTVKGIGRRLMGFFGGPWGLVLTVAGTAIGTIVREVNKANDALQEHGQIAERLAGEYDRLTNKLRGLKEGTPEYTKTLGELKDLNGEIAKSLPELVDGFDLQTQSIKINRQEMQNLIDASQRANDAVKESTDVSERIIKQYDDEILKHRQNAQEWENERRILQDLIERRDKLQKALAEQNKNSEKAKTIQQQLAETESLIADIAQEAGLKRTATIDMIIAKIDELQKKELQKAIATEQNQQRELEAVKKAAIAKLEILDKEIEAYKSVLPGGKWYQYTPFFLKGKYNILPGGEFWDRKALAEAQKEAEKQNEILREAEASLKTSQKRVRELKSQIQDIGTPASPSGGGGYIGSAPATGKGGSSISSTDWLEDFIDKTLAAVNARERLNASLQRSLDMLAAERDMYLTSAKSLNDYVLGLQKQSQEYEILERKQIGIKKEIELYRNALATLESRQKTLNTRTSEGQEAYNRLGDEIENVKEKMAQLQQEWFSIERTQRAMPSEQYREMSRIVDKLVDSGEISLQQQFELYSRIKQTNLLYEDRLELQQKIVDIGKRIIEQAIDEQIKVIESQKEAFKAASDARIEAIQRQIDLLNEENEELERQNRILQAQKDIEEAMRSQQEAQQELEKAQTKLANVQNERNVRIFQGGVWTYIADPEAVRQAQEEVENARKRVEKANQRVLEAQQAFNDLKLELQREQYRRELEAQIEAERKKQDEFVKACEERKKAFRDSNQVMLQILQQGGQQMNADLRAIMDNLNATFSGKLDIMLEIVRTYSSQMRREFLSVVRAMEEAQMATATLGATTSRAIGGPIYRDEVAQLHAGEYVLTAQDVRNLGGFVGVEKLRVYAQVPKVRISTGQPNVVNNTTTNTMKFGNIVLPNVYDVSGFLRNIRQLAVS